MRLSGKYVLIGDNLRFGLLTDFADSLERVSPQDQVLLELARQSIEELNKRYHSSSGDPFFLFHRSRTWNSRDKKWMGYERKRGKLADFNAFLRGAATAAADRFMLIVGDTTDTARWPRRCAATTAATDPAPSRKPNAIATGTSQAGSMALD